MRRLWREYRADLEKTWGGSPGAWRSCAAPFCHPGVRAALLHRIAHRCYRTRVLRPFGAFVRRCSTLLTGAEIHPSVAVGPGLHLPHPTGVIIGDGVVIDGPATIFQQVTLGPRGGGAEDCPRIGSFAAVYPGARILGRVDIGARSQVGPNCVIYRSLEPGTTVLPPEPMVLEGLSFTLRFESEAERAEITSKEDSPEPGTKSETETEGETEETEHETVGTE